MTSCEDDTPAGAIKCGMHHDSRMAFALLRITYCELLIEHTPVALLRIWWWLVRMVEKLSGPRFGELAAWVGRARGGGHVDIVPGWSGCAHRVLPRR